MKRTVGERMEQQGLVGIQKTAAVDMEKRGEKIEQRGEKRTAGEYPGRTRQNRGREENSRGDENSREENVTARERMKQQGQGPEGRFIEGSISKASEEIREPPEDIVVVRRSLNFLRSL